MARPTPIVPCEVCGVPYLRTKGGRFALCSDVCLAARRRQRWLDARCMTETPEGLFAPCRDCDSIVRVGPMGSNGGTGLHRCAPCRDDLARSYTRRGNLRRRGVLVPGAYSLAGIGARDGWRCHLCTGRVDRTLSGLHPDGPTIDHLIPLAKGGRDEARNVALAHRRCNLRRGVDRLPAQLLLIG